MTIHSFLLSLLIPFLFVQPGQGKDFQKFFEGLSPLEPEVRILKSTEYFVNSPSGLDPLGEGAGLDAGPTFSLSLFDCTTYVETNLAIAFSKTEAEIKLLLNKIRYQVDPPNYFQRNHFMVTDWIPSNSRKGFVSEITGQISSDKSATQLAVKSLNKSIWFFHRVIDLLEHQKKSQKEILEYLAKVPSLAKSEERATFLKARFFRDNEKTILEKLPTVSIVMFIRNIPSTPTLVNHMGFILKKDGKLFLNHAPQAKPWKVQEVPLEDYFKEMDAHRAPIEGLLILALGKPV